MSRLNAAIHALENTSRQLDHKVRAIPPEWLARKPSPEVWSVLENLRHINEFLPYWIEQMQSIRRDPSQAWGRTHADPRRMAAVADESANNRDALLVSIAAHVRLACDELSAMQDSDLDIEGPSRNPRWGVKPIAFILDELIVKHLESHRKQIQRNVAEFEKLELK